MCRDQEFRSHAVCRYAYWSTSIETFHFVFHIRYTNHHTRYSSHSFCETDDKSDKMKSKIRGRSLRRWGMGGKRRLAKLENRNYLHFKSFSNSLWCSVESWRGRGCEGGEGDSWGCRRRMSDNRISSSIYNHLLLVFVIIMHQRLFAIFVFCLFARYSVWVRRTLFIQKYYDSTKSSGTYRFLFA